MNHNISYHSHLGNCGKFGMVGVQTINCTVNRKRQNKNDECCQSVKYLVYLGESFDFTHDQKCILGNMTLAKE